MDLGIMDRLTSLNGCVLDVNKLASPQIKQQLVDLNLFNDQDDEGEIMLLAMILLQLNGVKLPEEDSDLLNKKKRQRTSPDQLAILEQIFQTDKMPNQQTRVHLADQLGMSSRRVQIWFQNKRAKVKRSVSKPDGEECSSPSDSLRDSSCTLSPSISSPCSPSSPSSVPPLDNESPINSPTLLISSLSTLSSSSVVHQQQAHINPFTSLLPLDAPIISSNSNVLSTSPSSSSLTPSSSTTSTNSTSPLSTNTILDNTTKQLKAQQLQFSRTAPFVDSQPVLTASY